MRTWEVSAKGSLRSFEIHILFKVNVFQAYFMVLKLWDIKFNHSCGQMGEMNTNTAHSLNKHSPHEVVPVETIKIIQFSYVGFTFPCL